MADRHTLGVLHYDSDYDTLYEETDLRVDSVWPRRPEPSNAMVP